MKRVEIVCHRGANEYAPENTFAAAQLCVDWGMDYVEVDVNLSRDGVHYLLHGPAVDATTNGSGLICDMLSDEIDTLDAGSWFSAEYAAERVPRLEPFLRWIKGKAKVFLDVKAADLAELVRLIYTAGMESECFLWFSDEREALHFRQLDERLAIKVNVTSVRDVRQAHELFRANIVEVTLPRLSHALMEECNKRGLRVMVICRERNFRAFEQILAWGVDLVNVDHGDAFAEAAAQYASSTATACGVSRYGRPTASRVVLFLLDGCRPDALSAANTPVIEKLRNRGSWSLNAQTVMPSITLPCHTSLFHSVMPERHGIVTNDWSPIEPSVPSLIEVVNDLGYGTAAFYTWEQLRDLAPPGTLDTSYYHRLSEEGLAEVVGIAANTIATTLPTLSFVYLEATDAEGHRFGWMSPEYIQAVQQSDRAIGDILVALAQAGSLDDTVCVVMADHGGHEHGHGTDRPEDMAIPFIICGPGIKSDYEIPGEVSIIDIAPTILACLAIEPPDEWSGRSVDHVFEV